MKKYILSLIVFVLGISNVYALDIDVDSINISDKSDNIIVEDYGITSNIINSNITFNELNDYVTFEIKLKNNEKDTYTIENISDDNTNQYIKTKYEYDTSLDKPIYLTLSYDKELESDLELNNINITITLLDKKGNEEVLVIDSNINKDSNNTMSTIIENPNTGILLSVILSIISILLVVLIYYRYYKNKKNISTMILMLGLLLIPVSIVLAETSKVSLILNTENISVAKKGLSYVTEPQVPGKITVGDELAVDTEHFYVVSSNEEETVLLSKYNLYVGSEYNANLNNSKFIFIRDISPNEEGYGLQNEAAKGLVFDGNNLIGIVPFSGRNYWVDENDNLLPKYGTQEANKPWMNNNIYDRTYQETLPEMESFSDGNTEGFRIIPEGNYNNYSIALYVEEYVNKLEKIGLTNPEGRLITYNEIIELGCERTGTYNGSCGNTSEWLYLTSYWMGSALDNFTIWSINSKGYFGNIGNFRREFINGVRPVIVVPTSDINY